MRPVAGAAHCLPASDFVQAEKKDEQTAAQEQDGLEEICPDHRGQSPCNRVCAGDGRKHNDRKPEIDAKDGAKSQTPCEQDAGQVDEDVRQDGDDAERYPAGRSKAVL